MTFLISADTEYLAQEIHGSTVSDEKQHQPYPVERALGIYSNYGCDQLILSWQNLFFLLCELSYFQNKRLIL